MGKRYEVSDEWINEAMAAAEGNLALAAKYINENFSPASKVTRQNLQTWINDDENAFAQDSMDNAELSRKARLQQNNNNALRREIRNLTDAVNTRDSVLQTIAQSVVALPTPYMPVFCKPTPNGRPITVELLFSDLQVGKLMSDYDSKVARKRVDEWIAVVLDRLSQYETLGYKIEKIVLAVLGDIIESDKKHNNSGRACDIGTADQMKLGMEMLRDVVFRLEHCAPKMDVVMITGNHDHDDHGLNMFMPGREHLSWPMYHAVKELFANYDHINFFIPEGSFHVHQIYGQNVLYEHGVGVATSQAAMKKHVGNRIDQLKQYIALFRMGDKHNICRFNNDRYVVNGAFFGDSRHGEEYSGIAGYDGEPAQLMFAHVKRADNFRTSLFDSLAVQLGHVK